MSRNKPGTIGANYPERLRLRKHLHLTLPPDALALLTRLAKAAGVSRSMFVERLVRRAAKAT